MTFRSAFVIVEFFTIAGSHSVTVCAPSAITHQPTAMAEVTQ